MSDVTSSTREEYLSHIEKQKELNLSIREYCAQNNLDQHKFGYYSSYKLKHAEPAPKVFAKAKIKKESPVQVKSTSMTAIDPVWLAQFINSLLAPK